MTWTPINISGFGGVINAVAIAKGMPGTMYVGGTLGKVYVTINTTTWSNRSTGLPSGRISDIVISPTAPGTAFVAFHNKAGGRIDRTINHGTSWTNVTGTLPAGAGAQALAIDWDWSPVPGIYVGSGAGVYVSLDNGATWIKDRADLHNVNVQDLVIVPARRTIAAGTYGRGYWRSKLPTLCQADFDDSGFVDLDDFSAFVVAFELGDQSADFDGSGFVDTDDFDTFVYAFELGC
ncbi:MAG: hypothetical protein IT435_17150 [Phycisphaerales bacterium]|nr:hypothetical protein [Phycisphaerales bacterium]